MHWFCSNDCREAANALPRPWPFPDQTDHCPICGEPRPTRCVYLVARAGLDPAYLTLAQRVVARFDTYLLVEVTPEWAYAVKEGLASGLQLSLAETFDDATQATAAIRAQQARDAQDR